MVIYLLGDLDMIIMCYFGRFYIGNRYLMFRFKELMFYNKIVGCVGGD